MEVEVNSMNRSSARTTVEIVEAWRARNPGFLNTLKTTHDLNGLRAVFIRLVSGVSNLPLENVGRDPVKIDLDVVDYKLMAVLASTGLNPMILWFYLKGMGAYPTAPSLAWDSISVAVLEKTPGRFQTRLSRADLVNWLADAKTMVWFSNALHTFSSRVDGQALELFWRNGLENLTAYCCDNMERLTAEVLCHAKNESLRIGAILNLKDLLSEGRRLH